MCPLKRIRCDKKIWKVRKIHGKSTEENIQVEVCSKCHPFYTGKQTLGSKKGQVEKFNKKFGFDTQK